ncbi:MAG: hypothetical protein COS15_02750 [Caldiserica bacterium CG02_land_8_20_14_3_00_36_38]|nr:MAG: hypothetical protein COS15_02750 [Caldiserica bacterium CG02_land_8_20_14_3_00_36_38]
MKKYLSIILIIVVSAFSICFFLYKVGKPSRQVSTTPEILFVRAASNNTIFKVCTIGIDGKNLRELFTVNNLLNSNPIYSALVQTGWVVTTDQTNVNYIKNNLGKFKDAFAHPLCAFSKDFYAYSTPIEESDIATHSGEKGIAGNVCGVFKEVYLCNVETGKTVRLDKELVNQLPDNSFSKDGSLFVHSLSFSHDGKFLFLVSLPKNDLSVFSMEQMKFTGTFHMSVHLIRNVDKVLNNLYLSAGTDSSNIFQFNMDKKELKPLTNCQESSFAISPDNQNLVFIETNLVGKTDLGVLNLSTGTIKRIDYPNESEIAGFVSDSKHLIIKRYYKLSDTDTDYHIAIYLLNLNTLKEAKIYAESPGNK